MSVIGVEYRWKEKRERIEKRRKQKREEEKNEDAPQLNSIIIPSFHHKTIRHTIEIIKSSSYFKLPIFLWVFTNEKLKTAKRISLV